MDVRAFGSYYGQTASLPYGSGFHHVVASGAVNFPACRAIFIEGKGGGGKGSLTVTPTDMPNQSLAFENIAGDILLPLSCTAVISGSMDHVVVLF